MGVVDEVEEDDVADEPEEVSEVQEEEEEALEVEAEEEEEEEEDEEEVGGEEDEEEDEEEELSDDDEEEESEEESEEEESEEEDEEEEEEMTPSDEDQVEHAVDKLVEHNVLTLRMISAEYRDIPDAVKFQWKKDRTVLTDIDREFISKGRSLHARKARRHRLRRWQEDMAQSSLDTIIDAMLTSHDLINERTRRFMRNHGIAVPFENPEDLKSAMNLI